MTAGGTGKRCRLRIDSEVIRGEDDADVFGAGYVGLYYYAPGSTVIAYSECQDGETVRCRVTVSDGAVLVERGGVLRLEISPGVRRSGAYRLPFGEPETEYTGELVEYALDGDGGTLEFSYHMEIGGTASENRVLMTVRAE